MLKEEVLIVGLYFSSVCQLELCNLISNQHGYVCDDLQPAPTHQYIIWYALFHLAISYTIWRGVYITNLKVRLSALVRLVPD